MMSDMLRPPHQDRDRIVPGDHAAIDADVHYSGYGIPGDAASISEEVTAAIEPVPMRGRKFVEIDVGTLENVLLHRTGCDKLGGNAAGKERAGDLDQLARMRVGRQSQHHCNAAIAVEPAAEDAPAAALRLVVVLDVLEKQRLAGSRPLREAHDGAELEVPIHLGLDPVQLVLGLKRRDPVAQVSEGGGTSLDRQIVFSGLQHFIHAVLVGWIDTRDGPACPAAYFNS